MIQAKIKTLFTDHFWFALFGAAFIYTLVITNVFQLIIFPRLPSISSSLGILKGDNIFYHEMALGMAQEIKTQGFSAWKLFPEHTVAGINVGILSLIYALFGVKPYLILPLNSLLHALAYLVLAKIFFSFSNNKFKAAISALPFLLFPTTLLWVSQLHKDTYAILAWFLFIYAVTVGAYQKNQKRKLVLSVILSLCLMVIIRPLYLNLIGFSAVLLFSLSLLLYFLKKVKSEVCLNLFIVMFISLSFFKISTALLAMDSLKEKSYYVNHEAVTTILAREATKQTKVTKPATITVAAPSLANDPVLATQNDCLKYSWAANGLPGFIDSKLHALAGMRLVQLCALNKETTSTIDLQFLPASASDFIKYLPRAFQIALFFPTPNLLLHIGNVKTVPVLAEMLVFYLFVPFLAWGIFKSRNVSLFSLLLLVLFFETFLAYIVPNMGTYHRIRFPFFCIFLGIGINSFIGVLETIKFKIAMPFDSYYQKLKSISYKTSMVLVLNLFGFFLFFLRDIMATRIFGLSSGLDTIYILILIPTTLSYFLFFPLYESQTPKYQTLLKENIELEAHFWKINFYILVVFVTVCLLGYLIVSSSFLTSLDFIPEYLRHGLNTSLVISLPLLLMGGWIISANILLNSLGRIFYTTASALTVPVVALLFIVFGNSVFHEKAFLYGMVLGQVFNFGLIYAVVFSSHRKNILFWRVVNPSVSIRSITRYFTQGSSYFCLYGMSAMSASFAVSLHVGAVSMVLLVNKFVSFFANLFQNAFNTVLYPYFSRIQISDDERFKKEKFFYLCALAFLGFLGVFLIAFISDPIAKILFLSSKVKADQVKVISSMIRIGGIQLPMIMSMILFFKWLNLRKDLVTMFVLSMLLIGTQYFFLNMLDRSLGLKIAFLAPVFSFFIVGFIFILRIKKIEKFRFIEISPFVLIWIIGLVPLFIEGLGNLRRGL